MRILITTQNLYCDQPNLATSVNNYVCNMIILTMLIYNDAELAITSINLICNIEI